MALDGVKNFAIVTVSTGYDDDDTSIVLETGDGAKLPDPATANFNLVWWDSTNYSEPALDPNVEIVRVTGKSTDTLTVTRAQESTSGSTKNTASATYKMALTVTAKMITDIGTDLDAKVTKALFDANTIIAADSDNTPAAVSVAESRVVGRKASGNIDDLTLSEVLDFIGSAAEGDILYRGSATWARLGKGSDGQVLTLASGVPSWAAASGGGSAKYARLSGNFSTTSGSLVDVTGLSIAVSANKTYLVSGVLNCEAVERDSDSYYIIGYAFPSGGNLTLSGSGAGYSSAAANVDLGGYTHEGGINQTSSPVRLSLSEYDQAGTWGAYYFGVSYFIGLLYNGSTAGNFKIQLRGGGGGSFMVKAGSFISAIELST